MSADLTDAQWVALAAAAEAWKRRGETDLFAQQAVKAALAAGVPLNTLARRLETSRPKLRRLARG